MNNTAWDAHVAETYRLQARNLRRARQRCKDQQKRAEKWKARAIAARWYDHCVYCGAPAHGPVCTAHSDLVALDDGAPG